MKWNTLKKLPADLLPALAIEVDERDHSIKAITVLHAGLPVCRIFEEYGSLRVSVPAPPEMETKYVVAGEFMGLTPVRIVCGTEFEASQKLAEFNKLAGFPDDEKFGLKIEPIEVPAE